MQSMSKRGAVTTGKITGAILGILMLVVFVSMLPSLISVGATSVSNLFTNLSGMGAVIGTDAAAFAGNANGYIGWFWVIGPFILVVGFIVALFLKRGRR